MDDKLVLRSDQWLPFLFRVVLAERIALEAFIEETYLLYDMLTSKLSSRETE